MIGRNRGTGWRTCRIALAMLAATLVAPFAVSDGGARVPPGRQALDVRTSAGVQRFLVTDLHARRSSAWRENGRRGGKGRAAPAPTPGFEVTSRVLVRLHDPRNRRAFLQEQAHAGLVPSRTVRGYVLLATDSIVDAVSLANLLSADPRVAEASVDIRRPWVLRTLPTDPRFDDQWHLRNTLDPLFDVNIEEAWALGYTGSGVVIGIVENAWEHTHPDLAANFLEEASQAGGAITGTRRVLPAWRRRWRTTISSGSAQRTARCSRIRSSAVTPRRPRHWRSATI